MTIQWYPGHMAKAKRVLKEHLKLVDIVLELLDARIPYSSSNPDLEKLVKNKDRIIILNKKDLANPQITAEWIEYLNHNAPTFAVNTMTGAGLKEVLNEVQKKADAINRRLKKRGRNPRNIRLLIIGIPNVGKSALINRIAGRSKAKVENRPGVTRGKQWIKVRKGLLLMDSPGILWPRFENQEVGLKLAATGAIRTEVFNEEEVAYHLLKWLLKIAPEDLQNFFGVELVEDPYEMMLVIGRKRGFLQSGGRVQTEQTARMILKEFRNGRIGQVSLERPDKGEDNGS
ncbi:ribosome biogenesis GTPase YlqF [Anoxybacter fermentans]|uniref:Ribosome biogenesis GTPase A n=1 Tax=Anoxybacter fermentans TaxID=1323375 RepID=A0A3Q9HP26_9FIRM|nr:ribosome biogenesis GTPase YlqF [Anoxybacter fermentans]AZR72353.1 ribosome biogenesis GTPase YlqF [Anoxybacter fermentans]